jgi:hypothetical protein
MQDEMVNNELSKRRHIVRCITWEMPRLVILYISALIPVLFQVRGLARKPFFSSWQFHSLLAHCFSVHQKSLYSTLFPRSQLANHWYCGTTSTCANDTYHYHLETFFCIQTVDIHIKSLLISTASVIRCPNTWLIAPMLIKRNTDVPSATRAVVVRNARIPARKSLSLHRYHLARQRCTWESFNCQRPSTDTSLTGTRTYLLALTQTSTFVPCANVIQSNAAL